MLKLLEKIFGVETVKIKTNDNILSKDDISKLVDFEEDLIDNGLKESEKMLEDCLKTKKDLEDKAGKLLTAQLSLIAVLIAIINTKSFEAPSHGHITQFIWLSIAILTIGFVLSIIYLESSGSDYGCFGKHPDFFLQKESFMTKKENFKFLKAYMLVDYKKRIDVSMKSNESHSKRLKWVVSCLVTSVITFLLGMYAKDKTTIIIYLSIFVAIGFYNHTKIIKVIKYCFKKIIS